MMIRTRIVSSLEKFFLEDRIDRFAPLERISALRRERLSFQLLHALERGGDGDTVPSQNIHLPLCMKGELAK